MEDLSRHLEQQRSRERARARRRPDESVEPAPHAEQRGLVSHAAGEVAWEWDVATGRVARAGAYFDLCGFNVDEIRPGIDWWRERIHPEDRASVVAAFDKAFAGERRELVLLYRLRRKNGSYALILDRAFVLGNGDRLVGFAHEVTAPSRDDAPVESPAVAESAAPPTEVLSDESGKKTDGAPAINTGEESRELAARLAETLEEERQRLARELHDEIGQLLTSLRMALQTGPSGRAMVDEILDELFTRVRDISTGLWPPMLETLGLGPTLSWHCERFSTQTGVYVNLMTSGLQRRYPPKIELAIFRVVQEALTNVARHAETSNAQVAVRGSRNFVEALILDRGIGFTTMKLALYQTSGITGMRERAHSAGGRLHVASAPDRGTRVSLFIPISKRGTEPPRSDEVI